MATIFRARLLLSVFTIAFLDKPSRISPAQSRKTRQSFRWKPLFPSPFPVLWKN
jgi:hypothetical protein